MSVLLHTVRSIYTHMQQYSASMCVYSAAQARNTMAAAAAVAVAVCPQGCAGVCYSSSTSDTTS
jgi:hypothetical protein